MVQDRSNVVWARHDDHRASPDMGGLGHVASFNGRWSLQGMQTPFSRDDMT
jgi:hypothetical protein